MQLKESQFYLEYLRSQFFTVSIFIGYNKPLENEHNLRQFKEMKNFNFVYFGKYKVICFKKLDFFFENINLDSRHVVNNLILMISSKYKGFSKYINL